MPGAHYLCQAQGLSGIHTALVTGEKSNFQFILRLLNTNVDGKQKIMYALTKIKGVGRRYSNLVCKKADVDLNKRYVNKTSQAVRPIRGRMPVLILLLLEPVRSPQKSSNASLQSSKIRHNTKFRHGSSTDSAISSMARTLRSWPMVWTASFVRIWRG